MNKIIDLRSDTVTKPTPEMREAMKSAGWLPEQVEFMVGLFYTVRQGWVAPISPAVSSVLGRDPISFEQFARENADAWK